MNISTTYHSMIETIMANSGMSDKLLHVHAGLAIYLASQLVLRTRRTSLAALAVVVGIEVINETMDRLVAGSWNLPDTLTDFASTIFWPLMITLIGRYRRQRWAHREAHRAFLRSARIASGEPSPARV